MNRFIVSTTRAVYTFVYTCGFFLRAISTVAWNLIAEGELYAEFNVDIFTTQSQGHLQFAHIQRYRMHCFLCFFLSLVETILIRFGVKI